MWIDEDFGADTVPSLAAIAGDGYSAMGVVGGPLIKQSGDGLIPGGLSPIVSKRIMGTAGAVPRAGFPAKSVTARSFQKLT